MPIGRAAALGGVCLSQMGLAMIRIPMEDYSEPLLLFSKS